MPPSPPGRSAPAAVRLDTPDAAEAAASDGILPEALIVGPRVPADSMLRLVQRLAATHGSVMVTAMNPDRSQRNGSADCYLISAVRETVAGKQPAEPTAEGGSGGRNDSAPARQPDAMSERLNRMFVRSGVRVHPVSLDEVQWFEAHGDYVAVHTRQGHVLANVSMQELETMLDRDRFLRIHRSIIVNLDRVVSLEKHRSGRFRVRLSGGQVLVASRLRSRELRRRII